MSVAFAEGRITQLRRELKVLVHPAEADALGARLVRLLGVPAPRPTWITSVYFDRPGLPLATQARHRPLGCVKIRLREYWPDLGDEGRAGRVVLEVKREHGTRSAKERVWVPRRLVGAAVAGEEIAGTPGLSLCDPQLEPVAAVLYERRVYQAEDSWRVTVDRRLSFHEASWDLVSSRGRTMREGLGPAVGEEPLAIVEVKHAGEGLPALAEELAARARPFSKFVAAVARVGSGVSDGAAGG